MITWQDFARETSRDPRSARTELTWDEVERLISILLIDMEVDTINQAFPTIVSVGRGGVVPARLLADRLGVRSMRAVWPWRYGTGQNAGGRVRLAPEDLAILEEVRSERALYVDEINDRGDTLKAVRDAIPSIDGNTLFESAVLMSKMGSKINPTYQAVDGVPSTTWVVFPWDRWEYRR